MAQVDSVEAKLHRLRERFIAGLPKRIAALSDAIERRAHEEVTRGFHSLAGIAGTYGLAAVAALSAEGEEACAAESLDAETCAYLSSLVDGMLVAAAETADVSEPAVEAGPKEEGRVLCVEDDLEQARYITAVLENSGYEVRTLGEPLDFNYALSTFQPDLILMDILLPGRSGVDLVRELRADATYARVPIVFLTRQRQIASRIEAVGAGGDDFLTKPVQPELLRSVVSARLRASRAVQVLIDHDGLTGALTHAAFMRRAEAAMQRARRHDHEIALVMLDLDHFKSINDHHGHLAGDLVLSTFGPFLTRNVRKGDDVGRYGGEEFALLLRDVSLEAVQSLVNRLLADFSAIPFRGARGNVFHVSFSAGVAMLDPKWSLQQWKQRADDALYSAKHRGRARVEAA